eukprot:g1871.t1
MHILYIPIMLVPFFQEIGIYRQYISTTGSKFLATPYSRVGNEGLQVKTMHNFAYYLTQTFCCFTVKHLSAIFGSPPHWKSGPVRHAIPSAALSYDQFYMSVDYNTCQ